MGNDSAIAWTDSTLNFWIGCDKVSPACANCYMFRDGKRYGWAGESSHSIPLRRTSSQTWNNASRWKEPRRIFVCSWSDFFHEGADEWRNDAWAVIRNNPQHTFQILTKRPERIAGHLPDDWPFKNVWLGVSVEFQRWADTRIPLLLDAGAPVSFISAEPLLGPLDLRDVLGRGGGPNRCHRCKGEQSVPVYDNNGRDVPLSDGERPIGYKTCPACYNAGYGSTGSSPGIDWLIVGGESGPRNRPMAPAWAESLLAQCQESDVPFFFKQWGGRTPKAGGRVLDGREWSELPALQEGSKAT